MVQNYLSHYLYIADLFVISFVISDSKRKGVGSKRDESYKVILAEVVTIPRVQEQRKGNLNYRKFTDNFIDNLIFYNFFYTIIFSLGEGKKVKVASLIPREFQEEAN